MSAYRYKLVSAVCWSLEKFQFSAVVLSLYILCDLIFLCVTKILITMLPTSKPISLDVNTYADVLGTSPAYRQKEYVYLFLAYLAYFFYVFNEP